MCEIPKNKLFSLVYQDEDKINIFSSLVLCVELFSLFCFVMLIRACAVVYICLRFICFVLVCVCLLVCCLLFYFSIIPFFFI